MLVVAIAALALAPSWLSIRLRARPSWVVVVALALLWVSEALVTGLAIRISHQGQTGRIDEAATAVVVLGVVVLGLSVVAVAAEEIALRSPLRASRARRLLDWVLYVAIAITLVVGLLLYAAHQAKTGGSRKLPLKWLGFAGMTAVIFGQAVKAGLQTRGGQKFWLLLGAFFGVHTVVGIALLMRIETVPLLLYAILATPEYMILLYFLDYFLASDPRYR